VDIQATIHDRYPPTVESAAFAVVAVAVGEAARAAATHAEVRVMASHGWLVVEVSPAVSRRMLGLEDRVGALGGSLDVNGDRLRAEIPCA
jgi:hypothetical protein